MREVLLLPIRPVPKAARGASYHERTASAALSLGSGDFMCDVPDMDAVTPPILLLFAFFHVERILRNRQEDALQTDYVGCATCELLEVEPAFDEVLLGNGEQCLEIALKPVFGEAVGTGDFAGRF